MLLIALGGVVLGFVFLLVSLLTDNAAWAWACIAVCVLAAVVLVADILRRRAHRAEPAAADLTGADDAGAGSPAGHDADAATAPQADEPAAQPSPEHAVPQAPEHDVPQAPEHAMPQAPEHDVPQAPEHDVPQAPVAGAPGSAPVEPASERAPRGDEPTEVIAGRRAAGSSRWDPATVDAPTQQIAAVRDPEDVSPADLIKAVPPPRGPVPDSATEPDEESVARGAGESVASATAEVVVVDERPRFHLRGCAWLGGRAVIPLPVGEAVELGFSPCGVCRPVAALTAVAGGQNR